MGIRFDALTKDEKAPVAAFVRRQYDSFITQQGDSYIARNAKADPERWQDGLRELIASDPKRVAAIIEAEKRMAQFDASGVTN